MMQTVPGTRLTTGIAIAGAALIAVVPGGAHLPGPARQLSHTQTQALPVALTAGDGDILTPYADLLTNTANNLAGLLVDISKTPMLGPFFTDPMGAITHIPDALIALNTMLPAIDVTSSGLPIQVEAVMTASIGTLLALIGPFVTVGNALSDIVGHLFNLSDPLGALTALLGAPATLLDAFLNGNDSLDIAGFTIPMFNGLLTGGQTFQLGMNIGQLVDLAGVGNLTIGELADQSGLSDMALSGVLTGLLDFMGVGNPSITDLAAQFGLGDQSVADLAIGLLGFLGIDNPTITGMADEFGLSDMSIADVLNQVLGMVGLNPDQSLAALLMSVLQGAGFGDNPTVGGLAVTLLDAMGMGNLSIAGLVQQLGFGDQTLGELAKQAANALLGPDTTVTGLFQQLGFSDMTIGDVVMPLLDQMGIGDQSLFSLINPLINPNPGDDITLGDMIVNILNTTGMDMTLSQVVAQTGMADTTLGGLLQTVPVPGGLPTTDPLYPYGPEATGGHPEMLALVPWKDFLASSMTGAMGAQTFKELAANQMGMQLGDFECGAMAALFAPLNCDRTLSSYMGNRDVYDTLDNLKADGHGIVGIPANTTLADVTLGQFVQGTGEGDLHLSSIVLNLNLTNPISQILMNLGLDNVTVDQLITNGFPWLINTKVLDLLNSWGLNNLSIDTIIDRLHLDMTVTDLLNKLGLDQVQLTTVVNDLLGGVYISNILNNLGLNDVSLGGFLNNLLGGVYIGDLLNDLNLNNVHLNDVLTSLLGGVQISSVLDGLGLGQVHLDSVINDLLGGVNIGALIDDFGISGATLNSIIDSLGLGGVDTLGVNVGDFFGLLPQLFVGVPEQIAQALAG